MPALTGIRVLDLTRLLPGPFGTMILADQGADVVKVEEPGGGDSLRELQGTLGGLESIFAHVNRGKRSVTINLREEKGRAFLHRLLARADVLVEGFRPGVMRRFELDYASLAGRYPKLVYCSISGFGQSGPQAHLPGHDLNYQGYAGLLPAGALAHESVALPPTLLGDFQAGLCAALGIVLALHERLATGMGRCVDVSLTRALAPLLLPRVACDERSLTEASPARPWFCGGLACYNVYRAADGRLITLAALEPKFWRAFCTAVGRPDLTEGHLQTDRQTLLGGELAAIIGQHPSAYWVELARRHDVCVEIVRTPTEALADERLRDAGWPGPFSDIRSSSPPPAVGADTWRIFVDELGCDATEVQEAINNGVLATAMAAPTAKPVATGCSQRSPHSLLSSAASIHSSRALSRYSCRSSRACLP